MENIFLFLKNLLLSDFNKKDFWYKKDSIKISLLRYSFQNLTQNEAENLFNNLFQKRKAI